MSAFSQLLEQTYYAKRYDSFKVDTLESMYAAIMKHILSSESRQDPYSVATIYSYLYHKEHEVNRLIIALECVRYRISADEASISQKLNTRGGVLIDCQDEIFEHHRAESRH